MSAGSTTPRIVVTGLGPVCSLGLGRDDVWDAAINGRSGAREITRFDTDGFRVHVACETDIEAEDFMDRRLARRSDPMSHIALAAARLAIDDADLGRPDEQASLRQGVIFASGGGGAALREEQHRVYLERGADRVNPFTIPHTIANTPAALIAAEFGLRGPNFSTTTACAAGADAIGVAVATIRRGDADVMVAGGSDALVTPLFVAGFDAMRVLSRRNDDPVHAARPFDRDRDGFLIGEGGAALVLETEERARGRGAEIICEIAGYGASADAHHTTDPDPTGTAQGRAITACLASAGITPAEVGYINTHGGGSQPGDPAEIAAITGALGPEVAANIAVSGTKSMHGHCMGGTGALEASLTALALTHGILPPTINLENPAEGCGGVRHVAGEARQEQVDVALSTSFGLGGQNTVLCLTRRTVA